MVPMPALFTRMSTVSPRSATVVQKACASVGIGDIAGDHLDAHGLAEFGGEVAQPLFATGDQRHAVAAGDEFARDVGADSG